MWILGLKGLIQLQARFNYFTNLLNNGQFLQWWQCYSQNV